MRKRWISSAACKWLLVVLLALPIGMAGQEAASAAEEGSVVNSFDPDLFTGWGLWAGDGSSVTKETVDGVTGKAVQINYNRSPLGWGLVAHAELPANWELSGTRTIQFYAKGDGEDQRFSIGIEEKDGGDKFRKFITLGGREWTLVTIPVSELEYQDGGGNQQLDWDKVNSFNFSPEDNRTGYFLLDDITLGSFEPSLTNGFAPDVFTDWGLWAGDGSSIVKSEADGTSGKGIRFDYTRSENGWGLVAHGSLPVEWNLAGTQSIRFMIRGDGSSQRYSIGVEEKDGGDKFRQIIEVTGEAWIPVALLASELEFQDGGGNHQLDWNLVNGINISPENNGSGYWILDELSFYKGGLLPPVVLEPDLKLIGLSAVKAGSVFTAGQIDLQAKISNVSSNPTEARELQYTVKDMMGELMLSGAVEIAALEAGGSMTTNISFEVEQYGYFTVDAVIVEDSGAVSERTASFAYVAEPSRSGHPGNHSSADDTLVGFSTHYDYLPNDSLRAQEADLIRLSGSGLVRNDFLWDKIEIAKGEYDWSLYDSIVEINRESGLQMIGLLAYTATWASTAPQGAETPEHYAPRTVSEYADFVYRTVSRYKDTVHLWEIWNEPNLDGFFRPTHNAEAYVELLKAGYLAAKRADPKATVVMSGLSGTGGGYLDEMIQLGAADYTDAVVIHPYQAGDPEAGNAFVHDIASVRAKMPNKEVWLTEWGWRTDEQGLEKQALYSVKGYLLALAMEVSKNALYSFNIATDTQFGLADSSLGGTVKPIYPAVAGMNQVLSGSQYVGDVELGDSISALAFNYKGSAESVLALWSSNAETVKLNSNNSLQLFDMFGNASTLSPADGQVTVQVSEHPIYVKGDLKEYIRGAIPRVSEEISGKRQDNPANAWLMKSPYYQIGNSTLTRGYDNSFSVEIYNYSNHTLEGTLQLQDIPIGWFASSSDRSKAYEVNPYSSQTVTFQVKPPADAELGSIQATVKDADKQSPLAAKKFELEVLPKLAVKVDKKAIRLTNAITTSVSGNLVLNEPSGWTLLLGQTDFSVDPGETIAIPYTLTPNDGTTDASTLELTGNVIADGESIPFRQSLSAVIASLAAEAPVIDGDVDPQWQSAPKASANEAWQVSSDYRPIWNANDLSAEVRLKWDASRLYVLAEVKDDKVFQPQSGGGMWQGDSLQLAFDARNEAGPGYGPQVYELQIGKQDGGMPQIFKGMGFSQSGVMDEGAIAVVRNESAGTTVYELSIPFSELDGFGDALTKKAVGFSFLVNDNDGSGREGYIEWSSGVGGAKNASQFGTLWLN